jgi:hypothetical protein
MNNKEDHLQATKTRTVKRCELESGLFIHLYSHFAAAILRRKYLWEDQEAVVDFPYNPHLFLWLPSEIFALISHPLMQECHRHPCQTGNMFRVMRLATFQDGRSNHVVSIRPRVVVIFEMRCQIKTLCSFRSAVLYLKGDRLGSESGGSRSHDMLDWDTTLALE